MKFEKTVHKKQLRKFFVVFVLILIIGCAWKGIRKTSSIFCSKIPFSSTGIYSADEEVINAIALSYLVYGCEACNELSGTVNELIEKYEMGILKENFGIRRTDDSNPSTALFDTAEYVANCVGEYRFLGDIRDDRCNFYGAVFCDDNAKCVWIAYAGSVSFRDAIACAEFVLSPRLSCQEKHAFELYEYALKSNEVQNQSYQVRLTGHSLGGAFATMVSCASGCKAIAINGAVGIAIDKYRDMEGIDFQGNQISNHMTSPRDGGCSLMEIVQRMMFFGDYQAVDCYIYPGNGYTTDTHCTFSFIEFEDDKLTSPRIP